MQAQPLAVTLLRSAFAIPPRFLAPIDCLKIPAQNNKGARTLSNPGIKQFFRIFQDVIGHKKSALSHACISLSLQSYWKRKD
jgi:hypothetical protein